MGKITISASEKPDVTAIIGLTSASDLHLVGKKAAKKRHRRRVVKIIFHEDYKYHNETTTMGPDIALLKLNKPVPR